MLRPCMMQGTSQLTASGGQAEGKGEKGHTRTMV